MAKNLTWPQARKLALDQGKLIRRAGDEYWITAESTNIWRVHGSGNIVLFAVQMESSDMLATDWTDESWLTPTDDGAITPNPDGSGNSGGGNVTDGKDSDGEETEAQRIIRESVSSRADEQDGSATSGGGSFFAPGGGGGGGGSGGGGGKRRGRVNGGPNANPPIVTVAVGFADPDNVTCYSTVPTTVTVYATVSIDGGPAGLGSLSVTCPNTSETQLAMGYAGFSRTFEFEDVDYNEAGGAITIEASYATPDAQPDVDAEGSAPYLKLCPNAIDTVTEQAYSCTDGVITITLRYAIGGHHTDREWTLSNANGMIGSAFAGCPSARTIIQQDGRTYLKLTYSGPEYEYVDVTSPNP